MNIKKLFPHNKAVNFLLISSFIPCFANAQAFTTGAWYKEDPNNSYYYIQIEIDQESINTFMDLQFAGGWTVDIAGSTDGQNFLQARLKRNTPLKPDSKPFPESKAWYLNVVQNQPRSWIVEGSGVEIQKFFEEKMKSGYMPGFTELPSSSNRHIFTMYRK
ncbi:hypothetical protein [Marinomonas sp. 2405UD68-3]|uniref:hypothetical protein n=1 Tax=Marinomonas sp. 2405UD68-3 TaxID=3391835 RepID=UPI0039C9B5B6